MTKVIKLAQAGYDVKTAGDENLIYSSQWPLLKIYKSGHVDSTSGSPITLTEHNLGYVPFYWVTTNLPPTVWFGGASAPENRAEFGGGFSPIMMSMDSQKLQFVPITILGAIQSYSWYIFALDITKQFTAPTIKVGATPSGRAGGKVFKVAKPNKDINSQALEDYIIHSRTRSPLIHSVNPGIVKESLGTAGYGLTIYHNLGYTPLFFGFIKRSDGTYNQVYSGGGGSAFFAGDETKVRYQETTAGTEMTIVILKDPFIIDYRVDVSV